MKKLRHCEEENKESEDRLSDLPDCVLLRILSFLNAKHVVQTCILSKRYKLLWKHIPTLMLQASTFPTVKQFSIFVFKILTLRDTSTALLALDLHRPGCIEPHLLRKILNYVRSHNTRLLELGISVRGDSALVFSCVSSCRFLTSLKLSVYPRGRYNDEKVVFPKSLNLSVLTNLDLTNFAFCCGGNDCAEPFSAFGRLDSLAIRNCMVKDAQILNISSETLVNFTMHNKSSDFAEIELSAPSLCTFTFTGSPDQKICGIGLSSVKHVNIAADIHLIHWKEPPILLSWLLGLANVKSLTLSSTTLQILSLVPDLLEVKLHSLCYLKSMEIKLVPPQAQGSLPYIVKNRMLKKAAAKSREEADELRTEFEAGFEPPPIPDGIVEFLLQNSPSAKVDITTKYPGAFKLEQDDKLSNEDEVEKHQPNTNSQLLDKGQ